MLFSSLTFILYFMPIVILLHYILPKKLQNAFLLLASLVFYSWGEAKQVPLFTVLLFANWGIGRLIDATKTQKARRAMLLAGLVLDFGALIFYKYVGFLMEIFGLEAGFAKDITLPLGISFFTFQAAGYLVDVYRRQTSPEKSFINFGAFLFMFPQLIAGPIIRYSDMSEALHRKRRPSARMLESGMGLLVAGLAGFGTAGYPEASAPLDGIYLLVFLIEVAALPLMLMVEPLATAAFSVNFAPSALLPLRSTLPVPKALSSLLWRSCKNSSPVVSPLNSPSVIFFVTPSTVKLSSLPER